MRNVSGKVRSKNQNTHFMFRNFLFRKSCPLWDNVVTHCKAGQATE